MPGFYTPPPPNSRLGSRLDVFAPAPRFPVATETTARQVIDLHAHGTRKRCRQSNADYTLATSHSQATDVWADSSLSLSRFSNTRSPPPLANDRYELAGGMEGPDMFAQHPGDYDDYFQLEKQREMWSTPTSPPSELVRQQLAAVDSFQSSPNGTKPWVLNQILNIVGGVAGKLVQFCSVPFRGFQAGGGQAYVLNLQGPLAEMGARDPFINSITGPVHTPLPGQYPEDTYGVVSIESLENERPRMSKRLRTGEKWVVVDKDGEMDSRPGTPRLSERRVPIHTRSPSQIPRPMSKTAVLHTTPKRPSLVPVSRRSTMDRRSLQGASKMPSKVYTTPRSYSRQGYGSPVMFQVDDQVKGSPLPKESQRLINKVRREEMEDDARMHRMGSQMTLMLKEAREALGSKFAVEDVDMVQGEMDDEGFSEESSWYKK
ncbi:uncharacterized protein BDR25DRAFT_300734 [Lindgomyces ingoldianus]|uniref:Uncharacterized protein n=1 Tax=Lindgomyces ingoldianus TaxID=673940 RepID=A0ACB6R9B1_9PLEO|nr:uncharacterized protein BDR25DRAFT_300734 [Lindgomyces ingoldianus]KAF2475736.1 hypothetical protein BDR25DRAFT_300734 [Lindgomyces ingoldianus]